MPRQRQSFGSRSMLEEGRHRFLDQRCEIASFSWPAAGGHCAQDDAFLIRVWQALARVKLLAAPA
jgi:hypothetical protein